MASSTSTSSGIGNDSKIKTIKTGNKKIVTIPNKSNIPLDV